MQDRLFLMQNNFDLFEPIHSLRGVLLNLLKEGKSNLPNNNNNNNNHQYNSSASSSEFQIRHLLSEVNLARKARRFQIASNAIHQVRQITTIVLNTQRHVNIYLMNLLSFFVSQLKHIDAVSDIAWRLEEAKVTFSWIYISI